MYLKKGNSLDVYKIKLKKKIKTSLTGDINQKEKRKEKKKASETIVN